MQSITRLEVIKERLNVLDELDEEAGTLAGANERAAERRMLEEEWIQIILPIVAADILR